MNPPTAMILACVSMLWGVMSCGGGPTSEDATPADAKSCSADACVTPPASKCLAGDDTLRIYSDNGTCGASGICEYAYQDVRCPNCATSEGCELCLDVTCESPPGACYASPGECSGGSCTYQVTDGATCDDGDACTSGDTCDSDGVCIGDSLACNTPPPSVCRENNTVRRTFNAQGTCNTNGDCDYTYNDVACPNCDINPSCDLCFGISCDMPPGQCYADPGTCNGGSCSYQIDAGASCDDANACTTNDTCSATAQCAGTPIVCDSPPAPECFAGNTMRRIYNAQGVCNGTGDCDYSFIETQCPSCDTNPTCDPCFGITCDAPPGQCYQNPGVCVAGVCNYDVAAGASCDDQSACTASDTCTANAICEGATITCNTPPAAECVANNTKKRTYNPQGMCDLNDGCGYTYNEVDCPDCASNPSCDLCVGVTCDAPPADQCIGDTLHTYAAMGNCSSGQCDYMQTDIQCANGCIGNACRVCPWTFATVDNGVYSATGTSIKTDASGGLHVTFAHFIGGLDYAYRPPTGTNFTVRQVTSDNASSSTSLALDSSGGAHIVYRVIISSSITALYYAYKPANGTFTIQQLDGPSHHSRHSSIALDSQDGIHISFIDENSDSLKYAYRPAGGGAFAMQTIGQTHLFENEIAIAADDGVHIVYRKSAGRLLHAHKPVGGAFATNVVQTSGASWLSLATDTQNGVHIAFNDYQQDELRYAFAAAGGTFAVQTIDAQGDTGWTPSIKVDSSGGVHIAYQEWTDKDLRYAYRPSGGAFSIETLDSEDSTGHNPALHLDQNGIHLTYHDPDDDRVYYANLPQPCQP